MLFIEFSYGEYWILAEVTMQDCSFTAYNGIGLRQTYQSNELVVSRLDVWLGDTLVNDLIKRDKDLRHSIESKALEIAIAESDFQ